jgi:hypothetical protein
MFARCMKIMSAPPTDAAGQYRQKLFAGRAMPSAPSAQTASGMSAAAAIEPSET